MNNFLKTLETNANLNLDELEIGYGAQELSFSANLDCEVPSLASLLASVGLEVPNNGAALSSDAVAIALSYERSRNNPSATAYSTVAKVVITGPLQLSDIFAVADLPTAIIPAIDKIELRFELDKSSEDLGGTAETTVSNKSVEVGFQLSFKNGASVTPNILVGSYQCYEENGNKISGIVGTLHAAGSAWTPLGFAKDFPLDIDIKNPFLVHASYTTVGVAGGINTGTGTSIESRMDFVSQSSAFTLVGAGINMATGPSFPHLPVVHQFLKAAQFHFNGVNLVYSNSVMLPANIIIANGLLGKVNLPALETSPFTMGMVGLPSTSITKGINLRATASIDANINVSQWIDSWPSDYVPKSELAEIAKIFPPFKITEIDFEYHQGNQGLLLGAKAEIEVSQQLSAAPLPFALSASCQKGINGKSAWVVQGGSTFSQPIAFASIIDSVLSTFGIKKSIPNSISALNLSIKALSFSYNTSTDDFDFTFSLDKPAPFSGITGNDISTDKTSPHSFTTFGLSRLKTATSTLTQLRISIDAGLKLEELLDLQGDLPTALNPTLETVEFTITLGSTNVEGASMSSDAFNFSTTFTDNKQHFEFEGAYSKVTSGTTTSKLFGGSIHSPTGGSIDMGEIFPLDIELKDVFLAKVSISENGAKENTFSVFGSDLNKGTDIDLGSLPVVGHFLSDAKFSFNDLRFTYSKAAITPTELLVINNFLLEMQVPPLLTTQSSLTEIAVPMAGFPAGYSLQGSLIVGGNQEVIPLHTSFDPTTGSTSSPTSPTTATPIGKRYGPVILQSIGLGTRDGGIGLKFTGGLAIGPVAFELIDFEITSPISHFDPDITIAGLGLDINKGALSLQGLMMEGNIEIPEMDYRTGKVITDKIKAYSGALTVDYKQYNLAATGSYAQLPDGSPTMFMYAFLGTPLGGPPVFFVTGVAAGFGYNRTFDVPAPTEISEFPLIQPVMGTSPAGSSSQVGTPSQTGTFSQAGASSQTGTSSQSLSTTNFAAMNKDFLPKEGAFWGAVGVRGESFKMVESFVLLDVQFGDTLEIDVIGISNMTFPTPKEDDTTPPLAKVLIGLEARILPEQGIVRVDGGIQQGTYFLDPSAHVQGGFGMLSVLADQTSGTYNGAKEGAFIFSIGGYPSHYTVPNYYPNPKQVEFNWQLSAVQSIKGSAYFAVVPEAMFAGGVFENLYSLGGPFNISAWFILAADFAINWKPYHYTADVSLEIDVCAAINVDLWLFSVHIDFNMDLGADLQVWGPPFAGKGYLTVHAVVTFSVDVSFGDANPAPTPIDWTEFSGSFLPATDKILNAAVGSGLLSTVEQTVNTKTTKVDVVNPKDMSLVCHTSMPVKSVVTSTKIPVDGMPETAFGIAPMAKTSDDVQSTLTVTITKSGSKASNPEVDFTYKVLTRNLPSAMWLAADTEGTLPNTQGKGLISDLACGIEIKPKPQAPESPFPVTEPDEEIINMPKAEAVSAFTYDDSNFSMTA
jgi:hypothetical protein